MKHVSDMPRILVVAHSVDGRFVSFVSEQARSLAQAGCIVDTYGVVGKGAWGYLGNLRALKRKIREFKPDIVHAHYGLTGLLCTLQRKVPVVTTYHGSDIHSGGWVFRLSKLCIRRSAFNIFVSASLKELVYPIRKDGNGFNEMSLPVNSAIIPCGVDMETFFQIPRSEALTQLSGGGIVKDAGCHYVVFAGAFGNAVKNPALAKEAVALLAEKYTVELIELKGYTREQVNLLLNVADCLLMTSHREGSPMVVKEAMAAGCPVVSVDVGDVSMRLGGTEGCFIAEKNPSDIAPAVESVIKSGARTNGREWLKMERCGCDSVAKELIGVYRKVLKSR